MAAMGRGKGDLNTVHIWKYNEIQLIYNGNILIYIYISISV
jgi:hypothetical protein